MGQNPQNSQPNGLRPKFWEIAAASSDVDFVTPFCGIRQSRDMEMDEVADRMGWDAEDYRQLELGHMEASTETILTFCRVTNCHPLDLYSSAVSAETPLPREIFYSLVAMVVVPGFNDQDRVRSLLRLDIEHRRAKSMVLENRKYLQPLLISMGFSPDLKTALAPLYGVSEDEDDISARDLMDRSLLDHQMMLETDRDTYHLLHDRLKNKFNANEDLMLRKAATLFGARKAEGAVTELTELMTQWEGKEGLYRAFMRTPDIVGTLVQKGEEFNPAQVRGDKRNFFQAVKRHMELTPRVDVLEDHLRKADAQLKKFVNWWENDKTLRLLDWYEDCEVLKDFEMAPAQASRNDLKPGIRPMAGLG